MDRAVACDRAVTHSDVVAAERSEQREALADHELTHFRVHLEIETRDQCHLAVGVVGADEFETQHRFGRALRHPCPASPGVTSARRVRVDRDVGQAGDGRVGLGLRIRGRLDPCAIVGREDLGSNDVGAGLGLVAQAAVLLVADVSQHDRHDQDARVRQDVRIQREVTGLLHVPCSVVKCN